MTSDEQRQIREAYEAGQVYRVETICHRSQVDAPEYIDRLLAEKLETVRQHARPGLMVDLCCATGGHLFDLADVWQEAVGIDFSVPFIRRAREEAVERGLENVRFVAGDATRLPLATGSVGTLYCFSALYAIPKVEQVIAEIARVLAPGGRCILDLGNARSLNAFAVKYYTELPPIFPISTREMTSSISAAGLSSVQHRSFQILPLWADRPRWLWPLLHPGWKTIMKQKIGKRMLDEWVSGFPGLKQLAFRHLVVCEKAREP